MFRRGFLLVATCIVSLIFLTYRAPRSPLPKAVPPPPDISGKLIVPSGAPSSVPSSTTPPIPEPVPSQQSKEEEQAKPDEQKVKRPAIDVANEELSALNDALTAEIEINDLAGYGLRVEKFSKLLAALMEDDLIDRTEALILFSQFVPWWMPTSAVFNPWNHYPPTPDVNEDRDPGWPPDPQVTGFVMCVGNDNADLAAHSIRSLQYIYGSQLRFEVAYAGDQDFSPENRKAFSGALPGLEYMDLLDGSFDEFFVGSTNPAWALKAFAALNSKWMKVIVVDADVIFLNKPDEYFDFHEGLKETGMLFFHDRATQDNTQSRWAQDFLKGKRPSVDLENSIFWKERLLRNQESGVLFYNKVRPSAFMSLLFAAYMNTWEVATRISQQDFHGDKESFWLAAELSSSPYFFSPTYAGMLGYEVTVRPADAAEIRRICSHHPLHRGLGGKPLWFNSGLRLKEEHNDDSFIDREYAHFTHWVKAGITREEQPHWSTTTEGAYCVELGDAERLPGVVNGSLHNLRAEAMRADDTLLGG